MYKAKRKSCMMMAAVLSAATLLTACGGSGKEEEAKKPATTPGETTEVPESIDVSVMIPHFGGIPTEKPVHQKWEELMNEKLGTKINWEWNYIPYGEYSEKMNISLASGDLPDLFYITDYNTFEPYKDQELAVELSAYSEMTPNYMAFVDSVKNGDKQLKDGDGNYYAFKGGELPRVESVGIYYPTLYRYDIFEKEGIKIPETTDEYYEAAKKLKQLYPDSYPVYLGDWSGFAGVFHTSTGFFWDGDEYQYGPVSENYKDFLQFLNKLYAEDLIDPESFTNDQDIKNQKVLNGSCFMVMANWFNENSQWNNNDTVDVHWVNSIFPNDEKYGTAWQGIMNVNEPKIFNGGLCINTKSENIDLLVKLCDLQYTDEVIRLIDWGIEGESYVLDENGEPTLVDEIQEAENAWEAGDKWGMRMSASYRPGLQLVDDTRVYINAAPDDACYIDGEVSDQPWEKAFPDQLWPDSEWISPGEFAPPIQFTSDEAQENSNIMTAVQTYVEESQLQFIRGDLSFDEWDEYVQTVESMNYKQVLDLRNEKAAALAE